MVWFNAYNNNVGTGLQSVFCFTISLTAQISTKHTAHFSIKAAIVYYLIETNCDFFVDLVNVKKLKQKS